jgi:hypothetical protein
MSRAADDSSAGSSLDTPRPLEEENGAAPTASHESLAEMFYVSQNQSLKALALLSLGLKNSDGTPTFDPAVLPWSAALRPTALKMTSSELRAEVARRSAGAEVVPRPSQWKLVKLTDWLEKNPITCAGDIAFIRATIAHRISVAERSKSAQLDAVATRQEVANKGSKWYGKYPHLRLIHAVIDDEVIKAAYKRHLHVPSGRMALENRRTTEAVQSNVWFLVAKKWNDVSFSPTTSVKDSHSDFSQPISIPFDAVLEFMAATPEKVEERWNSMNLALKRAITNWERSGQGDGGVVELDDDDDEGDESSGGDVGDRTKNFGSLNGRGQQALDLRRNFFSDKNTYLLYLWDVLDEHGLVQSSMQQLLDGIGASDGFDGVPSVITGRRKSDGDESLASSKKQNTNSLEAAIKSVGESLSEYSKSVSSAQRSSRADHANDLKHKERELFLTEKRAINERIYSLRDKKRELEIMMLQPQFITNEVATARFEHTIKGIDDEINMKLEELNAMLETPKKNNRTPEDN